MIDTKTVAITRSKTDAKEFVELAEKNGIRPLPLPTIELVSKGDSIVEEFLKSMSEYIPDYTVFMSSKAVKLLFEVARKSSRYAELQLAVANTIVVAVGPKTGEALESEGIRVNVMPEKTFSSVGVGESFTMLNAVGKKAIIPRSGASTPFLKELLNKIGVDVLEIHLYDVCAFRDTTQWNEFRELFSSGMIDGIIFTSASSVRGFFEIMTKDYEEDIIVEMLKGLYVVAIGPFTADELGKFGVKNTISRVHTVAGSFEAVNVMISGDTIP
ncbi:MAG: uroporphyrinogen-III synthase [Thaumarchaeota archaeon]|nr:uroporphyrinogen-III synthase [Nitrososphaerota archaeon]